MSQTNIPTTHASECDFNAFLSNLVTNAIASLNARADEILEEIEMKHWESMWRVEATEISNEREHNIARSLLPFHSFEAWWDSLGDDEAASLIDDYQQFQFGPNGGEEFRGDFKLAVFSFLNSRDRQETPCTQSIHPNEVTRVDSRYHASIVGENVGQYDGIEVHGVRDLHTGLNDTEGTCYEIDNDNPELYSVYLHCVAGGVECVGDFSVLLNAEEYARELNSLYSWPYLVFCSAVIH